jgi:NAD(P)-dependent dehydrogenase (short-subunit alcohol dehydrogenase family)
VAIGWITRYTSWMTDGMATSARSLFDLTGKVAIVTGSTKGIGRAMVSGLAAAGASVVVSSRKQALCDEVAAEVRAESGGEVLGLACHVGEWDAIPGFVDAVRAHFGRIDVLVNNAGINPAPVTTSEMTLDYWRKVFAVNLEGPLRMSQCAAPVMRDGGGGSIVNIATMAAYSGGPNVCAYGASKAALVNLTKSNAQEWAPWKVRVNALSPGPFTTEMVEGAARIRPEFKDLIASGTMQKRIAEPSEIVGPVLYLASDASSFVTGDDISVSGGMMK